MDSHDSRPDEVNSTGVPEEIEANAAGAAPDQPVWERMANWAPRLTLLALGFLQLHGPNLEGFGGGGSGTHG